ncbi:MAG TPA: PilZ domain-containing protein [Solidesulfovibrio magneticus]|nr:PilZ domain-containing protein [Solidesulfovibrio magneticus]
MTRETAAVEEKRTYMRIPTRLRGHLRLVPNADEMPLYRETPPMGSTPCAVDPRDPGISEPLFSLLCTINSKLDMLLAMQDRDVLETDFPVTMDITEISGAGVRFSTTQELDLEQPVEAVIVLARFPMRLAGAMGRIIRREEIDSRVVYALDFTRIRERDLESIVQFVFQSQRDDLRGKKWD